MSRIALPCVLLAVLASLTTAAAPAAAQPPPGPRTVQRGGLLAGASIGAGSFHVECGAFCDIFADGRHGGGALSLHVGGMIGPRSALLFDIWAVGFEPDENRSINHNMASIAFRYFPGPRVWLQAGLGWANFSLDCRDDALSADCGKQSESGGAAVVSLGYELLQRRHLTVDLSLRAGSAKFEDGRSDMASLQLGLNWY